MENQTTRVTLKMPYRGRHGTILVECEARTQLIPVGPYRIKQGPNAGKFVPARHVQRNFAALVEECAKTVKA